jgi:hypothetical protein
MKNVFVLVLVILNVNENDDDYNDDVHLNYLLPYLLDEDQHQLAKGYNSIIKKKYISLFQT